jgi:hypothetical protein
MPSTSQSDDKSYQCRHIHASGQDLCYFHKAARHPIPAPVIRARARRSAAADARNSSIQLDRLPEDAVSIRIGVYEVNRLLAANQIDPRRAAILIYGLQTIASTFPRPPRVAAPGKEESAAPELPVEVLTLDPDLGPLAPVAEFNTEDEAHKGLIQRFMDHVAQPHPCKMCEYYEERERNRAEGRRLMAEVARRRSLGLPEYPIEPLQPYPSDAAWAAEEARQALTGPQKPTTGNEPGAPSSTGSSIAGQAGAPASFAAGVERGVSFADANDPPSLPPPPHAEDPTTPGAPNPDPETWAKFAAHLPNLKAAAEEPDAAAIDARQAAIEAREAENRSVIPTERIARVEGPPHLSLQLPLPGAPLPALSLSKGLDSETWECRPHRRVGTSRKLAVKARS